MNSTGNFLADIADLMVVSVSEVAWACCADASACENMSSVVGSNALLENFEFSIHFIVPSYFNFTANFSHFLVCVCEAELRLRVRFGTNI